MDNRFFHLSILAKEASQRYIALQSKENIEARGSSSEVLRNVKKKKRKALYRGTVHRYSKFSSDEFKKKFTYECMFSSSCNNIFESYGSESKAYNDMKSHLAIHLESIEVSSDAPFNTKSGMRRNSSKEGMSSFDYQDGIESSKRTKRKSNSSESENAPTISQMVKNIRFEHNYTIPRRLKKLSKSIKSPNETSANFSLDELLKKSDNGVIENCILTPAFPCIYDTFDVAALCVVSDSEQVITTMCKNASVDINSTLSSEKFTEYIDTVEPVLESVENVKIKSVTTKPIIAKCKYSIENLENIQQFERELAIDLISKLKAKKGKKKKGPLICEICIKKNNLRKFTAVATLMYHYRSHAGIKPFLCNICKCKFTRRHTLNYHISIHEGKCRFTCAYCGREFRHPSHFKEHLRRHTGETPYCCINCKSKFKTRNTFKRHLKMQHQKLLTVNGIMDII
ncbi:hypothetical protein CDAR_456241 [Caerostris darwini]|uniref:C2H2-type domain-containing protein n=1 Tax=Caerostris darwini TaxID=1538125 RepID=A0AAV4QAG5_9ARAC|nr:hypothetical protein CDAR_456241 [Caerostris darwini]